MAALLRIGFALLALSGRASGLQPPLRPVRGKAAPRVRADDGNDEVLGAVQAAAEAASAAAKAAGAAADAAQMAAEVFRQPRIGFEDEDEQAEAGPESGAAGAVVDTDLDAGIEQLLTAEKRTGDTLGAMVSVFLLVLLADDSGLGPSTRDASIAALATGVIASTGSLPGDWVRFLGSAVSAAAGAFFSGWRGAATATAAESLLRKGSAEGIARVPLPRGAAPAPRPSQVSGEEPSSSRRLVGYLVYLRELAKWTESEQKRSTALLARRNEEKKRREVEAAAPPELPTFGGSSATEEPVAQAEAGENGESGPSEVPKAGGSAEREAKAKVETKAKSAPPALPALPETIGAVKKELKAKEEVKEQKGATGDRAAREESIGEETAPSPEVKSVQSAAPLTLSSAAAPPPPPPPATNGARRVAESGATAAKSSDAARKEDPASARKLDPAPTDKEDLAPARRGAAVAPTDAAEASQGGGAASGTKIWDDEWPSQSFSLLSHRMPHGNGAQKMTSRTFIVSDETAEAPRAAAPKATPKPAPAPTPKAEATPAPEAAPKPGTRPQAGANRAPAAQKSATARFASYLLDGAAKELAKGRSPLYEELQGQKMGSVRDELMKAPLSGHHGDDASAPAQEKGKPNAAPQDAKAEDRERGNGSSSSSGSGGPGGSRSSSRSGGSSSSELSKGRSALYMQLQEEHERKMEARGGRQARPREVLEDAEAPPAADARSARLPLGRSGAPGPPAWLTGPRRLASEANDDGNLDEEGVDLTWAQQLRVAARKRRKNRNPWTQDGP